MKTLGVLVNVAYGFEICAGANGNYAVGWDDGIDEFINGPILRNDAPRRPWNAYRIAAAVNGCSGILRRPGVDGRRTLSLTPLQQTLSVYRRSKAANRSRDGPCKDDQKQGRGELGEFPGHSPGAGPSRPGLSGHFSK